VKRIKQHDRVLEGYWTAYLWKLSRNTHGRYIMRKMKKRTCLLCSQKS